MNKNQTKHLGAYGLIIKNDKILLIKKVGGPYDGKYDLPGGTIEFGETPEEALKRELFEEVGIKITKYELFDANSVTLDWNYKDKVFTNHHLGIFYKILDYSNEIKNNVKLDKNNNDSLGGIFIKIDELKKEELSEIAILEIEKLGYPLK